MTDMKRLPLSKDAPQAWLDEEFWIDPHDKAYGERGTLYRKVSGELRPVYEGEFTGLERFARKEKTDD